METGEHHESTTPALGRKHFIDVDFTRRRGEGGHGPIAMGSRVVHYESKTALARRCFFGPFV